MSTFAFLTLMAMEAAVIIYVRLKSTEKRLERAPRVTWDRLGVVASKKVSTNKLSTEEEQRKRLLRRIQADML